MGTQKAPTSEWVDRIRRLLNDLKLTQETLAARLGVSPPTVSRWMKGKYEPSAESYIALGNLARRPSGVYFWERAGLDVSGLAEAGTLSAVSSLQASIQDFAVIASGKLSRQLPGKGKVVAIPLLKVEAYGDRIPPRENISLSEVEIEEVLLAPLEWCPHPENMISMRLTGDSMYPTIPDGSIIFVDTAATDRDLLQQRLTMVAHRDLGFKVARFQRVSGSDLLVSENHKYLPVDVSNASKWKIFGQVLWWVSKDVMRSS